LPEYTPHHDFSMPALIKDQPSRFATILFYLNEDMVGGETVFPRWMNAETAEPLVIKPERGKAILFYNMLPDGNYDERSQHAALPVLSGEKVSDSRWEMRPFHVFFLLWLNHSHHRRLGPTKQH
jgi:prolyl 4-hydroxylase